MIRLCGCTSARTKEPRGIAVSIARRMEARVNQIEATRRAMIAKSSHCSRVALLRPCAEMVGSAEARKIAAAMSAR